MNATVAPKRICPDTKRPTAPWLSYAVFALCASLYLLPFMRLAFVSRDEGILISGAARIANGQVFARDFFEVMGPGTFYWLAAFFKLFGVTFLATRICLLVSSLGTAVCMYFLSRRVCKRYQMLPSIILAATYFGPLWPGASHHVDSNFSALLSVACLVLWMDKRWKPLLISAGVLAGLTTSFHQPKGIMLLFAMLLWLWVQRREGDARLSSLGLITAGYLSVTGIMLAYFWSRGALFSLFYANVVWPSHNYGAVNTIPYAQGIKTFYWDRFITLKDVFSGPPQLAAIGMVAILIAPFFFIAALPVLVPLSALAAILTSPKKWRIVTPEIMLYGFCGAALWLSEIHRKDIFHLVFGSPLWIILCIYFLDVTRKKFSDYALQLVAITAVWLATFNLIGALTAHSVSTRVGSIAVFKDDPVIAFVNSHIARGEEMLVYPYNPIYYFIFETTNPTPYSVLLYSYDTPSQFWDALRTLDQRKVKYVIWDTEFLNKAESNFPGIRPAKPADWIIEPYLRSHYRVMADFDGISVMERRKEIETK